MSSEYAISLNQVSKTYRIFHSPAARLKYTLFGGDDRNCRKIHALKNFSADIKRGQTVGIVGTNGSGKSTLLQIICGTLYQDTGDVRVNGKVAALLELGTSFNPEFTGRENILISGQVYGLTRDELDAQYDAIINFADIEEFIDQPVKTYSSGMFARLAFSVAVHVNPEIMIIDEALAVGDEAFQRKCFAKLEQIKNAGTTILLVSHSVSAILELCDQAIMIYKGERLLVGEPRDVVTHYQKLIYSSPKNHAAILSNIRQIDRGVKGPSAEESSFRSVTDSSSTFGTDEEDPKEDYYDKTMVSISSESYPSQGCEIFDVKILNSKRKPVNVLTSNCEYTIQFFVRFYQDAENVRFATLIKTTSGVELGAQWSASRDKGIPIVKAGSVVTVQLPTLLPFNQGAYFLNAGVHGDLLGETVIMHRVIDSLMFRIRPLGYRRTDRYVNILSADPKVEIASAEHCQ